MRRPAARGTSAALLAVVLAAGCGRKTAQDTPGTAVDTAAAATAAAATPVPAADTPDAGATALTVADLDWWQHGMSAELEAVHAAGAQLARATTATDTANVIGAVLETSTRAAGARAAGVDEDKYQRLRTELSAVVGPMAPIEEEVDVSKMPAAAVAQMRQSHDEDLARATAALPADVLAALRPRAAALRAQERALTAERIRAAGPKN